MKCEYDMHKFHFSKQSTDKTNFFYINVWPSFVAVAPHDVNMRMVSKKTELTVFACTS